MAVGLLCFGWPVSGQVIERGDTLVEIIGLDRWTPAQVEAELALFAPGVSIASSACAVILQDSIGFDGAAVAHYPPRLGSGPWVLITVIEPGAGSWQGVAPASGGDRVPARWAALAEAMDADRQAMSYLQDPAFLVGDSDRAWGEKVPETGLTVREELRALDGEPDWSQARQLVRSGDLDARVLAALVMANFVERDESWHHWAHLAAKRTDPSSSMAQIISGVLARTGQFKVDWAAASEELEAILRGANLFSLPWLLSTLPETGVTPELAETLLRESPELVLAYVESQNPFLPRVAHQFLIHAAGGEDRGTGADGWRAWLVGAGPFRP